MTMETQKLLNEALATKEGKEIVMRLREAFQRADGPDEFRSEAQRILGEYEGTDVEIALTTGEQIMYFSLVLM